MNKTILRKFISWFWGVIYLLPLIFIVFELFRNGYDFSNDVTSNISTFLEKFEMPLFTDIVNSALTNLNASNNFGAYCLLYLSSWFLFVTIIKFLVIVFYYLIIVLEDIISKWSERVSK